MALPAAMVGIVIMMVLPVPPVILDMLLTLNIAAAVLILLASLNVRRALDLASFPSLLLIATLFRLGLNVSTTRLILGTGEAGDVITAFGSFVIGGSVVVGLVVFLILVVIQFVVITNGATRVAEVGARFTLDAMPGKQMAIDADLNAGIIDEQEATRRRSEVSSEADFYGAMDGASKFVKGDAIAGVVVTVINLVGGLIIGVLQNGMSISEAGSTYSLLTVGDGLVSQIPALLISISSGIIVTRATGTSDLGTDVATEFARQSRPFMVGGGVVAGLGIVPGLPLLPFVLVGGASMVIGFRLSQEAEEASTEAEPVELEPAIDPDDPAHLRRAMRVEAIGLEVAADMVDLVDPARGGDLLDRVRALRRKIALEIGLVLPAIRTRDNTDLPPGTYAIMLHGVELATGAAPPGRVLVIADDLNPYSGEIVNEPVFGLPAKWVPEVQAGQAEALGATVVDRASVVTTHLAEIARTHAAELIGRQDVSGLLDLVRESDPAVVDDLGTSDVALPQVQWVLQELLREQVPIRDMVRILEVIGERARLVSGEELVESVRSVLGPAITERHARDGSLAVITLDPMLERELTAALGAEAAATSLDATSLQLIVQQIQEIALRAEGSGHEPVLLCSPAVRRPLVRLLEGVNGAPAALSFREVGPQVELTTVGTVSVPSSSVGGMTS